MPKNDMPNAVLENVRIGFLNFSGREGQYNRDGNRNFAVFLEPGIAQQMLRDGWNVKFLKPRPDDDENDPQQAYIQVTVSYKIRPPKIFMIGSRGKTPLGEDEVAVLDWADITTTDVILNPSVWEVNGKTGVKAYLGSLFATINEDELDLKYADLPMTDSGHRGSSAGPRFEED